MGRLLNPILVQEELKKKGISIFTPLEFRRVFGVSEVAVQKFLEKYARRNFFIRLKRGLYCLRTMMPSEIEIANRLYQPSYISFEYALSYHHLIPESVYTITSATTKPTREFTVMGKVYRYSRIKKDAFLGYDPVQIADVTILIARPEKALVDYLYFVDLKKKTPLERLRTTGVSKKKAIEYAMAYGRRSLLALAKEVL